MKLRLVLKQSLRDFKSKKILYSIFLLFLIVAFSIITGLFSFQFKFDQYFDDMFKPAANITFNYPRFASSNKKDDDKFAGFIDKNENLYKYVEDIFKNIDNEKYKEFEKQNILKSSLKEYIDVVGNHRGDFRKYDEIENQDAKQIGEKIFHYFCDEQIQGYKSTTRSFSKNLLMQYLEDSKQKYEIHNQWFKWDHWATFEDRYGSSRVFIETMPEIRDFWENKNDFDEKVNDNFKFKNQVKIESQINVSELSEQQKQSIKDQKYFFASPKYVKNNNLKLGDYYEFKTSSGWIKLLLVGTCYSLDSIFEKDSLKETHVFLAPNLNDIKYWIHMIDLAFDSSTARDYKKFSNLFLKDFELKQPNDIAFKDHTLDKTFYDNKHYVVDAIKVKNVLFAVNSGISILMIFLVCAVFYFIADQLVKLQRENLSFLRSLGVSKLKLSLLIISSVIFPLIIALIIGISTSSVISQIFVDVVKNEYPFIWPNSLFSEKTAFLLIFISIIMFIMFVLVTATKLSDKNLSIYSVNKSKAPKLGYKLFKKTINQAPSNIKIGFAFSFKNIYKNIVTFVLLLISFTTLFYSVQFNSSVKNSIKAIRQAYKPYESVKLQDWLPVTYDASDLTNQETNNRKLSYSSIQSLEGIKSINLIEDLIKALLNTTFSGDDIKNYMISQELIHKIENTDPEKFIDDLKNEIDESKIGIDNDQKEFMKKMIDDHKQQIISTDQKIIDFIKEYRTKLSLLNDKYNNPDIAVPINLLFGKTLSFKSEENSIASYWSHSLMYSSNINKYNGLANERFRWTVGIAFNRDDEISKNFALKDIEKEIKNKFKDSKTISIERFKVDNKTRDVPVLNVGVTDSFIKESNAKLGDILKITLGTAFQSDQVDSFPFVYIKIAKIYNRQNIYKGLYFDKKDFINMLYNYNYLTSDEQKDPDIQVNDEIKNIIKPIYEGINNDGDFLNNTNFSKDELPINNQYFTLPIYSSLSVLNQNNQWTTGYNQESNGKQITNYWFPITKHSDDIDADIESSSLVKYLKTMPTNSFNFNKFAEIVQEQLNPLTEAIQKVLYYLVVVSISISMILIILILYENRRTIILFKAMGYKLKEINRYLIFGYVVADILALGFAILIVFYIISTLSTQFIDTFNLALSFYWSLPFILICIIPFILFIVMMLISVKMFTSKQSPKNIFQEA
ncbi:ABC transporter permease [Mycoplasma yeatsii]|uniref:Polyhydroxyalkanoate synthesis regulator phasin n=1 Tax=Mycoplasma yeatsii TaxID=51365 RepID=A0ABU0NEZ4_9MOLU|nr:ABC transporter permease [Mycoplasma yeatsii]MDQ0568015.1 polyhydroxyalkanoate synthesis regulator phasin [Mycoplasma yeatsii]